MPACQKTFTFAPVYLILLILSLSLSGANLLDMKYIRRFTIIVFGLLIGLTTPFQASAERLPVFDAHIHYSHDVWDAIAPAEAVKRLRQAGVSRALVSSSGDDGTQMLYQAAPDFVIPSLRPYRKRGTIDTWIHDKTVVPYLKQRLKKYKYVAIGELHLKGDQASLPVVKAVIDLAREYELILHIHAEADVIDQVYQYYPEARILWAHAGFEYAHVVSDLLDEHPRLWADLSFRREIFNNKQFLHGWQELLTRHSDRFMLGIDTYNPQRWLQLQRVMDWQQALLKALPEQVARQIAYANGERVFASLWQEKTKPRHVKP